MVKLSAPGLVLSSASPSDVGADQLATVGTSVQASHADHAHGNVSAGTPSTQAFGDAAAAGSAGGWARGDHKHAFPNVDRSVVNFSGGIAARTFGTAFAAAPVVASTHRDATPTYAFHTIQSVSTTAVSIYGQASGGGYATGAAHIVAFPA